MSKFRIGDIVKGNQKSNKYGVTDENMSEGRVIEVDGENIRVRVLAHRDSSHVGDKWIVDEDCFDFVRHEEPITGERLQGILDLHKKYLAGEVDGQRADLSGADLRRANLSDADLSGANLSGANLSDAKELLSSIGYLDAHFERTDKGYIAYKTFGAYRQPPESWKIEPDSIITENVNPNRTDECGSGINVAPLDWVRKDSGGRRDIWKVLIEWPWLAGVIVPYSTDGKIRCEKVRLLEIVK